MALRIPTLDSPQVQATPFRAPRVDVNAPIESFGGGRIAERFQNTVQRTVGAGIQFAEQQKQDADRTAVQDYDSNLLKLQTDLQVELGNIRGKDTAGAQALLQEKWQKGTLDLDKMLVNLEQRAAGKLSQQQRWDTLYRQIQNHTSHEMFKHDNESTENHIKLSRMSAAQNYQDPMIIGQALADQDIGLIKLKRLNGWDEATFQLKKEEAYSQTHSDIISRYLANNNDRGAQAYFNANKDEITMGRDRIESSLKAGSIRGESYRLLDQYNAEGLTPSQSLEKANEIKDPELRDMTKTRIKNYNAEKKFAEDFQNEQLYQSLYDELAKTAGKANLPVDGPRSVLQLDDTQQERLSSAKSRMLAGKETITNWARYQQVSEMFADPSRVNEALKYNPLEDSEDLGTTEVKKFIDLKSALIKNNSAEMSDYRTETQIQQRVLADAGIEKGSPEESEFIRQYVQQIQLFSSTNGRKPTKTEMEEIGTRLGSEVVLNARPWYWNSIESRLYKASADDVDIDDIAPEFLADVRERLIRNRMEPNVKNIKEAYLAGLKRGLYRGAK